MDWRGGKELYLGHFYRIEVLNFSVVDSVFTEKKRASPPLPPWEKPFNLHILAR